MKLTLQIVRQQQEAQVGKVEFGPEGGTLGRQQDNDWVLLNEYVSRYHARILADDNGFLVEDMDSADGTYVNERGRERLEPHTPYALENGDRLYVGDFEILVTITSEATEATLQEPEANDIPDDWDTEGLVDRRKPDSHESIGNTGASVPEEDGGSRVMRSSRPEAKSAVEALLRGARMEQIPRDNIDEAAVCHAVGVVLSETVDGLSNMMELRIQFKEKFLRVDRTRIAPTANNPLKAGLPSDQILHLLLTGAEPEYQPIPEAIAEALRDTRTHILALATGMQAAFDGLLAHLNPDRIEAEAESNTRTGFLSGRRKAWDVYRESYERIANADFYEKFGKDFARAYGEVEKAANQGQRQ